MACVPEGAGVTMDRYDFLAFAAGVVTAVMVSAIPYVQYWLQH
jgi:hypothetical protein